MRHFISAVLLATATSSVFAWQANLNFNSDNVGSKAIGANAFSEATTAVYSKEQVYEGSTSIKNSIAAGDQGFSRWGGIYNFPARLKQGDQVWMRIRTYYPVGFDLTANPMLKFLRIRTWNSGGQHIGYDDWYIDYHNSSNPFRFIYEGENIWYPFGSPAADKPQFGKWETYEMYIKFDSVPASRGGQALVRFWKDGKLIGESSDRKTLQNASDYADSAYVFTYWNGNSPKTQSMYIDDLVIQTDVPSARDAKGNPFIGTGGNQVTPTAAPPSPPTLKVQ